MAYINGKEILFSVNINLVATRGLSYTLSSDGTYYICSGMGTATDTDIVIAKEYNGLPVTTIGMNAFNGYSNFASITIPDSVTSIESDAFNGCTNLTRVYITDIVAWCNIIYDNFFSVPFNNKEGCLYLNGELVTNLEIPSVVTHIRDRAFSFCDSLISVIIPDGVTRINCAAFEGCYSLTNITISNSVTTIREYAFKKCYSLESVVIGSGVTSIDYNAFASCIALTTITLPSSITTISTETFLNCINLTDIYVPWAEGTVSGAPWGATNATIHYNSEV